MQESGGVVERTAIQRGICCSLHTKVVQSDVVRNVEQLWEQVKLALVARATKNMLYNSEYKNPNNSE